MIPLGICQCGCGKKTRLAPRTHTARGWVKGKPLRFFHAHNNGAIKHGHCPRRKLADGRKQIQAPEYVAWRNMLTRCYCPNHPEFFYWGGAGVKVCERWRNSFENFLTDMGKKPNSSYSLDRWPNKDGHYEPGNCRWATPKQQNDNRRRQRWDGHISTDKRRRAEKRRLKKLQS
jgi:hypothetical protein